MPVNKKTSKLLRNAADPFVLHLNDEPYILTEEDLKSQIDDRVKKKRDWPYPKIKFVSLANQILKLRISNNDVSYEMTVKIEPDKLHIACSCGSPVQTLCNHSYQTLEKIIVFEKTDYFQKFMPNGIIEIALANKKQFKIKPDYTGVSIKPDEMLGSVYQIADKMTGLNFQEVFCLPPDEGSTETFRLTDLTYIILYSFRDKYFPFLLPCLGILNKAETDMKGFYDFITDSSPVYEGLTSEQKKLNGICHAMWQEIKNENGSLISADIEQTSSALSLFNLWNKALSLLHQQPFVYQYNFYHKFQIKDKPQKGRLQRIHISRQRPTLCFRLIDKTTFCQLELSVSIQGKMFRHFDTVSNFFIRVDKKLHLLSSLQDVAVIEWMRRCDNRITVFKEHFSEFRDEYLEPICSHYPFEMTYLKR